MPWMEILIVLGLMAEVAVLRGLFLIGGDSFLLWTAVCAVCIFGPLLSLIRSFSEDDGGYRGLFDAFVITPPFGLMCALLLRWT